jgi:hypothetical protein
LLLLYATAEERDLKKVAALSEGDQGIEIICIQADRISGEQEEM